MAHLHLRARPTQPRQAPAEQASGRTDAPLGHPHSPYLLREEVTIYARLERTKHARVNTIKWLRRHNVPTFKDGRRILVLRASVQAAIEDADRAAQLRLSATRRAAHATEQGLKVVRRKGA